MKKSSFCKAFHLKKRFALVEIAIVLCLLFLAALPATAVAAEQDDFVLDIYGNANEDDTIDIQDVTYIKRIISGEEDKTNLADAYYDGEIDVGDIIQTKLIILGKERKLTIIDSADRTVIVNKPVERLVCTLSHHLEALRILEVSKNTIVGVPTDLNSVFFPEFVGKQDVGGGGGPWNPDVEMILAQDPEVVILPSCGGPYGYTADEETELLEAAGVTVLRFCFNQPETFSDELAKSGYIFEKEDKADEFIAWHDGILSSIEEKLSGVVKKKVYSEHQPYTISTADDDIIAAAGGEDILAGIPEEADVETLANEEPDIVIRAVYMGETGYDLTPSPGVIGRLEGVRSEILTRATEHGWNKTAVDDESVYIISSELWTYLPASGCRPFVGQCYLAKWFHPDLFPDEEFDPKAIHQEYLTRFQGLDIDLDEQGVFVYHPEEHPDGN
jgi:iron complex transport system substrate-binding protein